MYNSTKKNITITKIYIVIFLVCGAPHLASFASVCDDSIDCSLIINVRIAHCCILLTICQTVNNACGLGIVVFLSLKLNSSRSDLSNVTCNLEWIGFAQGSYSCRYNGYIISLVNRFSPPALPVALLRTLQSPSFLFWYCDLQILAYAEWCVRQCLLWWLCFL